LGIGDWGLGIGDWAQSPIPNPQSPIPNPPLSKYNKFNNKKYLIYILIVINLIIMKKMKKTNILSNNLFYLLRIIQHISYLNSEISLNYNLAII